MPMSIPANKFVGLRAAKTAVQGSPEERGDQICDSLLVVPRNRCQGIQESLIA
jgi:hypothetical protein